MAEQRTWLIDFDDTLASGNLTWAMRHAFPKLVRENLLKFDQAQLQAVTLDLQERWNQGERLEVLLRNLFVEMGWPRFLERRFLDDLMTGYRPILFEDSLPFLQRLKRNNRRIIILSNNPNSLRNVESLGIAAYVDAIYTPYNAPDTQPKPHRSLWDYIVSDQLDIDPETTTIVGDDPWSDGTFAEYCGLTCWIVDRNGRLIEHAESASWRWVSSLADISI